MKGKFDLLRYTPHCGRYLVKSAARINVWLSVEPAVIRASRLVSVVWGCLPLYSEVISEMPISMVRAICSDLKAYDAW